MENGDIILKKLGINLHANFFLFFNTANFNKCLVRNLETRATYSERYNISRIVEEIKRRQRGCRLSSSSLSNANHTPVVRFLKSEVPFVSDLALSRKKSPTVDRHCRTVPATLRRPPVMLSKGERYRLDCIIIKRDKGRSEVKRLLTIAEDSRLIAYVYNSRSDPVSFSPLPFFSHIVAESVFSVAILLVSIFIVEIIGFLIRNC